MAEAEHASGGGGHSSPTEALLFVITCILIGVSTKCFLGRIKIPYTALLLVFGLCIGLLQAAAPKTEAFTTTLRMWMGIDPHLLLLIFLPTIGFSAALGQEPHLLRRNWGQILILAGPGVVITFLLIGLCGRYFFPYGWTWPQCLLFGAMLSATDPVAVVAVLHEVGADEKMASVIDGESLVNDGSALVVFLVLQQIVQGASLSAAEIAVSFVHLAVAGAALGLGFGLVTSFWLANIWNDPGLEIVLTLGAAYACYFVSEELAGASGLLAVVVMGFSMSLMGGRHITNRIKTEMHAFWNALEWLANTILFIWVGIALGFVLLEPASPQLKFEQITFSHHLSATDAGYAVVLYLWLLVARAVAIFVFLPLLSTGRIGYALTWRTALFMVWAGLRGAVGVAMSLFILLDPLIDQDEYKAHCVFYMALMAFATVLINGTTAKNVLQSLGLLEMTPQQLEVLQFVLKEADGIADSTLDTSLPDDVLGPADPTLVRRWSSIQAAASLSRSHHRVLHRLNSLKSGGRPGSKGSAKTDAAVAAALEDRPRHKKLQEYRTRLLNVVKASYGEMYQHFEISTGAIRLLQEATDKALDAAAGASGTRASPSTRHSHFGQSHHSSSSSSASASAADKSFGGKTAATAADDAEAGGVGEAGGGLVDWRRLRKQLELQSWDFCSRVAGRLGLDTIETALSQREVASKLQLVAAFVAAHDTAQKLLSLHLASSGCVTATVADELSDLPATATNPADTATSTKQVSTSGGNSAGGAGGVGVGVGGSGSGNAGTHTPRAADSGPLGSSSIARTSRIMASADGGCALDEEEIEVADAVLQESRAEADAALQYAHTVLLPQHPGLGRLLMSRNVAIQVLERQSDFLNSIEEAGLVRAEEVHRVQHKAAVRLEHLQHQRAWNVIQLEKQQAAKVKAAATAKAGKGRKGSVATPAAATLVAPATAPASPAVAAADVADGGVAGGKATVAAVPQQQQQRQQQQGVTSQPGRISHPGLLLDDLRLVRQSLRQRVSSTGV